MLTEEQEEIGRVMNKVVNAGIETIKELGAAFGLLARKLEEDE